jgi:hypothetical protein
MGLSYVNFAPVHDSPKCEAGERSVQTARKPNFVLDDHSSRPGLTTGLKQPTRRFRLPASSRSQRSTILGATGRHAFAAFVGAAKLPAYLVLLRVGFTVPLELPPTRWALTPPFHPYLRLLARPSRRFIFCCTGRPADLRPPSRTLSGTLPCGVRTFLPLPRRLRVREAAIVRPPAQFDSTGTRRAGTAQKIEWSACLVEWTVCLAKVPGAKMRVKRSARAEQRVASVGLSAV